MDKINLLYGIFFKKDIKGALLGLIEICFPTPMNDIICVHGEKATAAAAANTACCEAPHEITAKTSN